MDPTTAQAIEAWRKLYDGELQTLPGPAPGLEAVAVRRDDFRHDPGNWPKIFHHRRPTDRVLVLIHGLKDSPGYLEAIAARFAAHGVNVVLPLLPAHGRRDPFPEMRCVKVREWRKVVDRTVEIAATLGGELSIGGLSTGGALALDKCLRHPSAVGGKVFLFAAALGLFPSARLVLGNPLVPRLADAWAARKGDGDGVPGLGGNPIKYTAGFYSAGRQVHLLIKDMRRQAGADLGRLGHSDNPLHGRIFVAHSEADRTIPVGAVRSLVKTGDPGQHHLVPEALNVSHADLVLAEAMTYERLRPDEPALPRANPEFEGMIEKALAFLEGIGGPSWA